jgi:CheY-like chemotaxis protein
MNGRVLVVDDSEINRDLLPRRIEDFGHTVSTAGSGAQALEMLRTGGFDAVLLDLIMPEMDGYELLTRIKADPQLAGVPCVMLTALEDIESVVRCLQLGADDFLPKGFHKELLRARLHGAIEKKRLRDRVAELERSR